MELKSKYITPEDFLAYTGENLAGSLLDGDNPSDKVYAFLYRIEKRMEAYLNANFYKNVDALYPEFTDYQKEHYKLALLEQALYVYKNGDISVDSGYEQEQGIMANRKDLYKLAIAPNCRAELILCGLWNTHIDSRGKEFGFFLGWF